MRWSIWGSSKSRGSGRDCADRLRRVSQPEFQASLYGWNIRSEIPLKTAQARRPIPATLPVVRIRLGKVEEILPDRIAELQLADIAADGTVLVRLPPVGRFLIKDGCDVTVDPTGDATASEIEASLFGIVAGVLLHQQDILTLHGSAVKIGHAAIAITGDVGAGKSSLAAALVKRGHSLVSDDLCPIILNSGRSEIVRGARALRLWPDSADALGFDPVSALPLYRAASKARFCPPEEKDDAERPLRLPLAAVIRLRSNPQCTTPALRLLSGSACWTPIDQLVYRAAIGRALGKRGLQFAGLTTLANTVPILELTRTDDLAHLPIAVDLVESMMASQTPAAFFLNFLMQNQYAAVCWQHNENGH